MKKIFTAIIILVCMFLCSWTVAHATDNTNTRFVVLDGPGGEATIVSPISEAYIDDVQRSIDIPLSSFGTVYYSGQVTLSSLTRTINDGIGICGPINVTPTFLAIQFPKAQSNTSTKGAGPLSKSITGTFYVPPDYVDGGVLTVVGTAGCASASYGSAPGFDATIYKIADGGAMSSAYAVNHITLSAATYAQIGSAITRTQQVDFTNPSGLTFTAGDSVILKLWARGSNFVNMHKLIFKYNSKQ